MTTASDHKVLVVATDPVLAALVGGIVELSRLRPAFPVNGESPETALTRLKPLLAVLIDTVSNGAESDIFLARARKKGVQVLLFGSASSTDARRPWAEGRGVPIYTLPDQLSVLEEALKRLAEGAKRARSFERREKSKDAAPLEFDDRAGKRWSVYDRRSADRRQAVDREFVSESGEVRHCLIDAEEAANTSPDALIDQLERSILHGKD